MYELVLIRHGEWVWNLDNRFTGWTDVDLAPTGVEQARHAGRLLKDAGYGFDVAYTSVLKRAIWTLWHTLNTRPDLAAESERLAPERASLRRPAGAEQG